MAPHPERYRIFEWNLTGAIAPRSCASCSKNARPKIGLHNSAVMKECSLKPLICCSVPVEFEDLGEMAESFYQCQLRLFLGEMSGCVAKQLFKGFGCGDRPLFG
jgi:hypothetical protein